VIVTGTGVRADDGRGDDGRGDDGRGDDGRGDDGEVRCEWSTDGRGTAGEVPVPDPAARDVSAASP
jgi:hypothetical protein